MIVDPLLTTDHVRDTTLDTTVDDNLPAVPGYRVLREIARGGMGRVLAAHDLTLDRDVALKTLLPGAQADRFVRESKITARLPHPGIPPVHALGMLADGSPFLAMKLIAGQTLAMELKTADRRRLLQVFTQVCEAVGFAHSRGVVHRDLKPANVMVGAYGEVQVMDWGLAKDMTSGELSDETPSLQSAAPVGSDANETTDHRSSGESIDDVQTQAGTVLGTPTFMAPEVAAGNAGTKATDIYGLGATLYVLLTGQPPYSGASVPEVLKQVITTDPALFVATNSPAPAALMAICRKAMARNPAARYVSAEEIVTEVRHWLADEPVSVYQEPWPARAARWARRRKTTVVAAAVLLMTTAIAAMAAAGLVWQEEKQTKIAWKQAEVEKFNATENADAAIKVVNDLSVYLSRIELSGSGSGEHRKASLDAALVSYERLLVLNPDDESLKANLARTHRYRANLSRVMGQMADAEKSYREAIRCYSELAVNSPASSAHHQDLALTSRDFSLLFKSLGRLHESAEILEASIQHYETLVQTYQTYAPLQRPLAMMLLDRAELDYQLGRYADAERHARRSVELYARLADTDAEPQQLDPLFHGMAEIRLATALRELDRIDDALAVHNRADDRFAGMVKVSATRENLFEYHRAQAERALTLSRVPSRQAAGVADLDSAIIGLEKLAKQFPQFPANLRAQGMATLFRGRVKVLLNQREAAAQDLNAAAKIFEGLVGKFEDIPVYRSFLGQTYTALGQLDTDAAARAEWYRKAREMLAGALKRSPENAQDRKALAELDGLTK